MKDKLIHIALVAVILFIQLSAASFFKIGGVVPNFLIILIFFLNLFYGYNYKTQLLLSLIFGFLLDIPSILPFGFWMLVFFLFFVVSNISANYLINKESFLNIIFTILALMLFYEISIFVLLKFLYTFNRIIAVSVSFADVFAGAFYNSMLGLAVYLIIKKIKVGVNKYEYNRQIFKV